MLLDEDVCNKSKPLQYFFYMIPKIEKVSLEAISDVLKGESLPFKFFY